MTDADLKEREAVSSRVTEIAEKLAASMGMEVVLLEIKGSGGRSVVRAFIDQPGGITLQDCERFSKRFSVLLDVEDSIAFSYILEVSSPGIDRPLVKAEHFVRFAGKQAKVRMRVPLSGQRNFLGKILGVTGDRLQLETSEGIHKELPLAQIEKANLVAEI
jgi:ribosome maturation factor RimP